MHQQNQYMYVYIHIKYFITFMRYYNLSAYYTIKVTYNYLDKYYDCLLSRKKKL